MPSAPTPPYVPPLIDLQGAVPAAPLNTLTNTSSSIASPSALFGSSPAPRDAMFSNNALITHGPTIAFDGGTQTGLIAQIAAVRNFGLDAPRVVDAIERYIVVKLKKGRSTEEIHRKLVAVEENFLHLPVNPLFAAARAKTGLPLSPYTPEDAPSVCSASSTRSSARSSTRSSSTRTLPPSLSSCGHSVPDSAPLTPNSYAPNTYSVAERFEGAGQYPEDERKKVEEEIARLQALLVTMSTSSPPPDLSRSPPTSPTRLSPSPPPLSRPLRASRLSFGSTTVLSPLHVSAFSPSAGTSPPPPPRSPPPLPPGFPPFPPAVLSPHPAYPSSFSSPNLHMSHRPPGLSRSPPAPTRSPPPPPARSPAPHRAARAASLPPTHPMVQAQAQQLSQPKPRPPRAASVSYSHHRRLTRDWSLAIEAAASASEDFRELLTEWEHEGVPGQEEDGEKDSGERSKDRERELPERGDSPLDAALS